MSSNRNDSRSSWLHKQLECFKDNRVVFFMKGGIHGRMRHLILYYVRHYHNSKAKKSRRRLSITDIFMGHTMNYQ